MWVCASVHVLHKPRMLSDNGPSYVAGELADYLADKNMKHVRGAPFHPQTQGKIERWHQTLKNRILLEHYYLPGDLEAQVEAFVEYYNHQRYHVSLKKRHTRRCLLRQGRIYHQTKRKDQTKNHRTKALASPQDRRIISTNRWNQILACFKTPYVSNYLTTDSPQNQNLQCRLCFFPAQMPWMPVIS